MNKKIQYLIIFLLVVASFLAGTAFSKIRAAKGITKESKTAQVTSVPVPTQPPFTPRKSDKPEVKFFVMSFCPYGNQAEAGLEPVYQLLKGKVDFLPRYIVDEKKSSCEKACPYKVYNDNAKAQCEAAIAQGQLKDMEACKQYFPYTSADECLKKECASLVAGEYVSLHGAQELNQDLREICAFNEARASSVQNPFDNWWKFITLVNKNCTAQNADTCWAQQVKDAGLNTGRISSCTSSQKKTLLDGEIAESTKYQASGSPTVIINGVVYNGGRAPEDYKKAICSSFTNPPEECSKTLGAETAVTSGGCE